MANNIGKKIGKVAKNKKSGKWGKSANNGLKVTTVGKHGQKKGKRLVEFAKRSGIKR